MQSRTFWFTILRNKKHYHVKRNQRQVETEFYFAIPRALLKFLKLMF